jgi:hypothetical protein
MENGDCKNTTFWFTKDWLQLTCLSGEFAWSLFGTKLRIGEER